MAAQLPEEIVVMIFELLVHDDDAESAWPVVIYNHHVAQAPFIVAAVCCRWRRIALATSTLWTYFGFPKPDMLDDRHLLRLELLRSRVRSAPIDVVLEWARGRHVERRAVGIPLSIFNAIVGLHMQWKTARIAVTEHIKLELSLHHAFELTQWPLLEDLSFASDYVMNCAIPAAPRLRRIRLHWTYNSHVEPFIAGQLPALTNLGIYCRSAPILRGLAPKFGTQLVELALLDHCGPLVRGLGPESTLGVFSALQCLAVVDARWLRYIDTPALQKLALSGMFIYEVGREALRRFGHIRELQICDRSKSIPIDTLKHFSNIITLTFDAPLVLYSGYNDPDIYDLARGVLQLLAGPMPEPIWPHLERVHFGTALYKSDHDPEDVAQDVVDFVAKRNARASSSDEPPMARIVEVVANHPGAPEWFEEKLREAIAG